VLSSPLASSSPVNPQTLHAACNSSHAPSASSISAVCLAVGIRFHSRLPAPPISTALVLSGIEVACSLPHAFHDRPRKITGFSKHIEWRSRGTGEHRTLTCSRVFTGPRRFLSARCSLSTKAAAADALNEALHKVLVAKRVPSHLDRFPAEFLAMTAEWWLATAGLGQSVVRSGCARRSPECNERITGTVPPGVIRKIRSASING